MKMYVILFLLTSRSTHLLPSNTDVCFLSDIYVFIKQINVISTDQKPICPVKLQTLFRFLVP
jgi:hypothetical protein